MENGTKLVFCENVVTGNVQKRCSQTFAAASQYHIRTLHVCTEDTGYGAIKRYRGWKLGLFLDVSIVTCTLNTIVFCIF